MLIKEIIKLLKNERITLQNNVIYNKQYLLHII